MIFQDEEKNIVEKDFSISSKIAGSKCEEDNIGKRVVKKKY